MTIPQHALEAAARAFCKALGADPDRRMVQSGLPQWQEIAEERGLSDAIEAYEAAMAQEREKVRAAMRPAVLSAEGFSDNSDDIEEHLAHDTKFACPHCAGSGHKDDGKGRVSLTAQDFRELIADAQLCAETENDQRKHGNKKHDRRYRDEMVRIDRLRGYLPNPPEDR